MGTPASDLFKIFAEEMKRIEPYVLGIFFFALALLIAILIGVLNAQTL